MSIPSDRRPRRGSAANNSNDPTPSPPSTDSVGFTPRRFGKYKLLKKLGSGSMGDVFLAEDTTLERNVAIKIPKLDTDNRAHRTRVIERFLREARLPAKLRHSNLCPVHEVAKIDEIPFLAVAYIDGESLEDKLDREQRLTDLTAVELVIKLARGLAEAHAHGIVHRDLKPANIMLDRAGEPIIMDFGLAFAIDQTRMTASGAQMGTPLYMPPEQWDGDRGAIGPHSDQYSLGVILFQLLSGRLPYEGTRPIEILGRIVKSPPNKPTDFQPDLDPRLEAIVMRMIAKAVADRFESMSDVINALDAWASVKRQTWPLQGAGAVSTRGSPERFTAIWRRINPMIQRIGRSLVSKAGSRSFTIVMCLVVGFLLIQFLRLPRSEVTNSLGMQLVWIPAGEFVMGVTESDEELQKAFPGAKTDDFADERPAKKVRLTKPFYLAKHEVTVGQYRAFVVATGYKPDANDIGEMYDHIPGSSNPENRNWENPGWPQTENHPVVWISYNDALAFCAWLSKREGATYRLPTEAEWEFACRGRTTSRFYNGDDAESLVKVGNVADAAAKRVLAGLATTNGDDGYVFTAPVGMFRPNSFGLYDMHGNVWEWCQDWYEKEYYKNRTNDSNPQGPSQGSARSLRGGSWFEDPKKMQSSGRGKYKPKVRSNIVGFRVVRNP